MLGDGCLVLGVSTGRVYAQPVTDLTKSGGKSLDSPSTDEGVGSERLGQRWKAVSFGWVCP